MELPSGLAAFAADLRHLFLLAIFATAVSVRAETHHLNWEVAYQFKFPDCVKKLAITINGDTPGPTISVIKGDTIVVNVTNALVTENLAIHWHGIRQIGTPWSDGTDGVSQCPVLPGETFTYTFVADRPGTYTYHGHYGMQRSAGLYGLIQVYSPLEEPEPFSSSCFSELNFLLSDWWHKSTSELAVGLNSHPFNWIGEPQSLLINGRGKFDCSKAGHGVCNATHPDCSPELVEVEPDRTFCVRIASVTSLSALNVEFEGHNLTVVEADGHYVRPFVVKNLNIYSGETYSVLLNTDQNPSRNYWIAVNVITRKPNTATATAILRYRPALDLSPNYPIKFPPSAPPTGPRWNDAMQQIKQSVALRSLPNHTQPPPHTSDRVIILLNTQSLIDGYLKWALNHVSFHYPTTPYLVALKRGLLHAFDQKPPPETYNHRDYDIYAVPRNPKATKSTAIFRLAFNSTVDVVLQNANTLTRNVSEAHPWHLHGHDFWVLGYGRGKFDPANDPKRYNLVDPIMRNTVVVHKYGWTAIRFRADNPGVWPFHCHVEAHFFMGMGIVFEEGVNRLGKLPANIMGCGASKHE